MESQDCVFCKIVKGELPSRKVYEDDKILGLMDIDPFCDGHILLIPKHHYTDMMDLPEEILAHINTVAKDIVQKMMDKCEEPGMTVSYNYGDKQVVKHFHLHLLPNIDKRAEKDVEEMYRKYMN